jgi:hypothetical protein
MGSEWPPRQYVVKFENFSSAYNRVVLSLDPTARIRELNEKGIKIGRLEQISLLYQVVQERVTVSSKAP